MRKKALLIAVLVCFAGLFIFDLPSAQADDSVLDSSIHITAPATGETLIAGETYEIRWNAPSEIDDEYEYEWKIYYSLDGGNIWVSTYDTKQDISDESGIYRCSWKVPSVVTTTARIRVERIIWDLDDIENNDETTTDNFYNDIGNFSIKAATNISKPAKPSNLAATAVSGNAIDLSWTDSSSNETGFNIFRKLKNDSDYTSIGSVDKNITNYHDTGLRPETKYYYVVTAFNTDGPSNFSNCADATTLELTRPSAPSGLTAAGISTSEINLVWKDNSSSETFFRVERSSNQSTGYAEIARLPANTTSYKDAGLQINLTYYYRVQAVNSVGDSDYSPSASAKTISETKPPAATAPTMTMKFTIGQNRCDINGVFHRMGAAPVIKETRVLLPVRYVAAPLGATVDWNAKTKKVTISLEGTVLELWVNKNAAKVNGVVKPIDSQNSAVTPVIVPPGSTMLPLRFIAENLGCDVNWDPIKNEATVTYPKI